MPWHLPQRGTVHYVKCCCVDFLTYLFRICKRGQHCLSAIFEYWVEYWVGGCWLTFAIDQGILLLPGGSEENFLTSVQVSSLGQNGSTYRNELTASVRAMAAHYYALIPRARTFLRWPVICAVLLCPVASHAQITRSEEENARGALAASVSSMRNGVSTGSLHRVHLKASTALASAPDALIGDVDVVFEDSKRTVIHTALGKRFTTRTEGAKTWGQKDPDGRTNFSSQSSVQPNLAAFQLDRQSGLLPFLDAWAVTEKLVITSSPKLDSRNETVRGIPCRLIEISVPQGSLSPPLAEKIFLRLDTGDIRAVEFKENIGHVAPIYVSVRFVYDDYANFGGIRTPSKITRLLNGIPETVYRVTSLDINQ